MNCRGGHRSAWRECIWLLVLEVCFSGLGYKTPTLRVLAFPWGSGSDALHIKLAAWRAGVSIIALDLAYSAAMTGGHREGAIELDSAEVDIRSYEEWRSMSVCLPRRQGAFSLASNRWGQVTSESRAKRLWKADSMSHVKGASIVI